MNEQSAKEYIMSLGFEVTNVNQYIITYKTVDGKEMAWYYAVSDEKKQPFFVMGYTNN